MTIPPLRPDRLHHRPQQHLGRLGLAAITTQPQPLGGGHLASHRLPVHPRQPLHHPKPVACQPQTQHLSNLEPPGMPFAALLAPLTGSASIPPAAAPLLMGPRGWSHYWRKGGPMLLAELSSKWSHAAGGRQTRGGAKLKVARWIGTELRAY